MTRISTVRQEEKNPRPCRAMTTAKRHRGEGWHAHPSNNFLEENEDGTFLRISFFDDEGVFLETYDADFNFVSSRQLTKGIWTARGYFKGKDARYIVYKQNNYEQSDEKKWCVL